MRRNSSSTRHTAQLVTRMPLSRFLPEQYPYLLAQKTQAIQALFAGLQCPPIEVFASQPSHYRMRAEFRAWYDDHAMHYTMFRHDERREAVITDQFPPANEHINTLMDTLRHSLDANDELRRRLYQVEFLSTTLGQAIVSLIYHRNLDDNWLKTASALAEKLQASIIGRSRGQRIVVGHDCIQEQFVVSGHTYTYIQPEGAFTQPNAGVNQQMLQWASDQASRLGGDLLELYCGIGNFTLPLSRCFGKVLATEVAKTAVRALQANIAANARHNIALARLSAEEAVQALNNVRPFKRLAHLDLNDYHFSTLFVDPPRAGLDATTRMLATGFDNVLYISCNPQTLHRDVLALSTTHEIAAFAIFDQFPYTDHAECGALLRKRPA